MCKGKNKPPYCEHLLLSIGRVLGNRGWDKTAAGWLNEHTGQRFTMEAALHQESDQECDDWTEGCDEKS